MYKQFKQRLIDLPLRKKLNLIILNTLFIMFIIFCLSISVLIKQYNNDLYAANAQLLDNVISNIEAELTAISNGTNYIIADNTIQENLMSIYDEPSSSRLATMRRNVYEALYPYMFENPYTDSITLVLDSDYINMGNSFPYDELDIASINSEAINNHGSVSFVATEGPNKSVMCVRQLRQLKYLTLRNLAVLYVTIDIEEIVNKALTNAGYEGNTNDFVLFSNEVQIYPKETGYDIQFLNEKANINNYAIKSIDNKKKFIISGSMKNTGWSYVYFRDYNTIFSHINRMNMSITIFTFLCMIIAVYLTSIVIKNILKHIDYLMEKIKLFGQGVTVLPENEYDYYNRSDEIGRLHRSFDDMTRSVKILRDENYDKQLLLKDTTIKMLEQQIDPHFLYNTLDTINWLALEKGAVDISVMARSLGKLFRAAVTEDKELILLKNELEFLDSYIKIQKFRFKERLQFEVDVPAEYMNICIPKLSIQPLVENALKHSMEYSDETCIIQVCVTETEQYFKIKVSNTGSKFEENLLEKLEQNPQLEPQTGIGLTNIDSRLRLIYGKEYGLRFHNLDGKAVVVLHIPKDYRKEPPCCD